MTGGTEALIDAFEDLLDEERVLLLNGSIEDLDRLSELKASLVRELKANMTAEQSEDCALVRVRTKAQRNAQLLGAAAKGIVSVRDRLAAMKQGANALSTYGAQGERTVIGHAQASVEKRA